MKTALETACDAYQLRKEAEHRARARLWALQYEMVQWPMSSPLSPPSAAAPFMLDVSHWIRWATAPYCVIQCEVERCSKPGPAWTLGIYR